MNLSQLPIFFLDLQTTGAHPQNSHILEMAWSKPFGLTSSFLVEQPVNKVLPKRIKMVTGISDLEMEKAIPYSYAMENLQSFIHSSFKEKAICIIHFAQFERPFLKNAFEDYSKDIPFRIVCTHEISKRLLPNLPSRGIKGLAGYFGNTTGEFKRAACHVEATQFIWTNLVGLLKQNNIHTLDELDEWLMKTPKLSKTKYEYPLEKEKRLTLPNEPGIYRMLDSNGKILYIGKATSLNSRVNSYFRGQRKKDSRKLEMLSQVYDIDVTVCESPLEAAVMETDQIKKHTPYYNIALKVGNRSLYFFNRELTSYKDINDCEHTVGPFSNLQVFESLFKLREYIKNKENHPMPDENTFFDPLEPALIKEGLELFCQRHQVNLEKLISMRTIITWGIMWYKKKNKQEEEINLSEDMELDEEERPLNAEDIADKFERHFMRAGKAFLRSKKLGSLINSDIEFTIPNTKEKKLYIRNGKISQQAQEQALITCWKFNGIDSYDRMVVLLTELEKIQSKSGRIKIVTL